jgi:hypothetical protein
MAMMNPDSRPVANCDELLELLPAYAAGLVDAEERALFEAGLLDCPELMPELQEYADFSDALLLSMPPMSAPSHILDNLMQLTAPSAAVSLPLETVVPAPTPTTAPTQGRQNPIITFFRPTLKLRPALVAAVLGLLVISNVFWVYQLQQNQPPAPTSPLVNFAPFDDNANRISFDAGTIAWSQSNAAETWIAVFSVEALEQLPNGAYQLWLVRQDEAPISAGVFNADDTGNGTLIFEISEPIGSFDRLGVTIEPAGGSPTPTGRAVFSGEL